MSGHRWSGLRTVLGLGLRAYPLGTLAAVVLMVVNGLSTPGRVYALKLITDGVVQRRYGYLWSALAVYVVVELGGYIADIWGHPLRAAMVDKTSFRIDQRLLNIAGGLPGLEHHESPEVQDQIALLRTNRGQLTRALNMVVLNIDVVSAVIGVIGVLVAVHPLVGSLALFAVPSVLAGRRGAARRDAAAARLAEPARLRNHLYSLGTSAAAAKEIRVFRLSRELRTRHTDAWQREAREHAATDARSALETTVGWVIFGVAYVWVMLFVARRAINGSATPGDVLLALTLSSQLTAAIARLVSWATEFSECLHTVSRFGWLLDYAATRVDDVTSGAPPPRHLESGISFDGVSFRYPGTDVTALQDVTLHLPAGSTVAIVGENGAGKTTLVKLLCRYYESSQGTISVDGVALAELNVSLWR